MNVNLIVFRRSCLRASLGYTLTSTVTGIVLDLFHNVKF